MSPRSLVVRGSCPAHRGTTLAGSCGLAVAPDATRFRGEMLEGRRHSALAEGHARELEPHLHAGERARQHEIVEVAQVADAEDLAGELRSEEHTSELQSHSDLVCRLLLEKKKNIPAPDPLSGYYRSVP